MPATRWTWRKAATTHRRSPVGPTLDQLLARVRGMGIAGERYMTYADRRWGRGWRLNAHGRARAWDELERYRNDPGGYRDKLETELRSAT
jgi:hypothetical protein